ncbi:hypothetical protein [Enterobacter hormaechei]|jgi:hypothetical protein|uniref:hypothetical protein n=1 Tax=Enterobacter hormaechei TaxID=158836 RepID=UPI00069B56D1|nr:hypothetical protein [Enterobacter hormaechei]
MKQKFIEWFTKNNNGCSPAMEDDRSFVYEMTQHMFEAYQAGVAEGEAKCAALASIEAEPVAWLLSGGGAKNHVSFDSGNAYADPLREVTPLYAAPQLPQPAVPETVPESLKDKLLTICDLVEDNDEYCQDIWNACRADMLQGADGTLTNEGTIPVTQFNPVADLYGLTSPTGGETSFTFDAVEARDFIDGGWSCQEYVELERFQEAITNHTEDKLAMVDHSGDSNNMVEPVTTANKLPDDFDFDRFNDVVWLEAVASNPHMHSPTTSTIAMVALELNKRLSGGNSPVIPDGWVLVPVEPTMSQEFAGYRTLTDTGKMSRLMKTRLSNIYRAMIAASPQQEA